MKTKIYLATAMVVALSGISGTDAAWYGNHGQAYVHGGPTTACSPDTQSVEAGDSTYGHAAVALNNGASLTPHGSSPYTVSPSGTMQCLYWDSTNPTVSGLNYANAATNGWQNSTTISIAITANDYGGSNLASYNVEVYRVSGAQNTPTLIPANLLTTFSTSSNPTSYIGVDGYAYAFRVQARDGAGNVGAWFPGTQIVRIDTTPPVLGQLTENGASLNLLATTNQAFQFHYNDTGAPVRVWYRFEQNGTPGSYDSLSTPGYLSGTLGSYDYTYYRDISRVDNDRLNGGRQITIYIDSICDWANNCIVGPNLTTFTHNVFANPNYNPTISLISPASITGIADGSDTSLIYTIQDGHGNKFVPATLGSIGRNISMNLSNVTNSMFLDQDNRSGPTSVFINNDVTPLDTAGNSLGNQTPNGSDQYILNLKVYTPTKDGYSISADNPPSDPDATFGFDTNLVVSPSTISGDNGVTRTSTAPSSPAFRPLYVSAISGDLENGGFIEGAVQTSPVTVTKNSGVGNPPDINLQLEFNGANSANFTLNGDSLSNPPTIGITTRANMVSSPSMPGSTDLYTFLQQRPNAVANLSELYLSTHFAYTLGGHHVIYNSDIIGKSQYHTGSDANIGTQYGVKIVGAVASNVTNALTTGQFDGSTSIFGGMNKATIRNTLNKSIALATRSMVMNNTTNTIPNLAPTSMPGGMVASGGIIKPDNTSSIMKIEKNGGFISLGNPSGLKISGKRTLVVVGADVYITSNMYYDSADESSVLGVVVQKNASGSGGNLYINPSVTNLVGTYVLDGSVQSSNDGLNGIGITNISALKNQLYLYGSFISENTIGGSRMSPPVCPSLLDVAGCTLQIAQQYDLNYLRRYYLYNNTPFGNGLTVGQETCNAVGMCTSTPNNLIHKFSNTTSELARYPVIIEHNPAISVNPPPGFDVGID